MSGFLKVRPKKFLGSQDRHLERTIFGKSLWLNIDAIESVHGDGTYTVNEGKEDEAKLPQSQIILRQEEVTRNGGQAKGYVVEGLASDIMKRIAAAKIPCVDAVPEPETPAKKTPAK